MARKVRAYTELGRRIAELGKRQRKLAKVLEVSQQTVSKKLRGETAILVSDLEQLSKHYGVSITYFFEEGLDRADLATAWEAILKNPGAMQDLVILISELAPHNLQRIIEIVRIVGSSDDDVSSLPPAAKPRGRAAKPKSIAAEEPGEYK